jgi:transposase
VVRKLVSKGNRLHFVYEAGPCGYQIYRHLTAQGFDCDVVAPSRIPKPSGNKIKNDRRDALMLARLHRSGELTAVYVPRAEDEAIRDLTRAREDAKGDEKRSKQRLLSFLLRSGFRYTGGSPWSKAHMRWLSDIKMPHPIPAGRLARVYRHRESMQRTRAAVNRTDPTALPEWQLFPIVQALQSMRGVSTIVAATTVAEVGDLKRFQTPSELMSYLGLVPSEHSSGSKRPNAVRLPRPAMVMCAVS